MRSSSSPATSVVVRHQQPQRFAGPGAGRTQRLVVGDVEVQSNQNRLPLPGALDPQFVAQSRLVAGV